MSSLFIKLWTYYVIIIFSLTPVITGKEHDYCKILCPDDEIHILCNNTEANHVKSYAVETYSYQFDSTLKTEFVDELNKFRDQLASGKLPQVGLNMGYYKSASAMSAVQWDDELELLAERWASYEDACIITLNNETSTIVKFNAADYLLEDNTAKQKYIMGALTNATNFKLSNLNLQYTFFKDDINRIGCYLVGTPGYKNDTQLICLVVESDPESIPDLNKAYKQGTPCTTCTGKCSTRYTSLCDEPEQFKETPLQDNIDSSFTDVIIIVTLLLIIGIVAGVFIFRKSRLLRKHNLVPDNEL